MAECEIWRPIPGFNGYEVSDLGRVRSLDRIVRFKFTSRRYPKGRDDNRRVKGRILRHKWGSGYAMVLLTNQTPFHVHRLVLLAFVGECPLGKIGRHYNDDRRDNRLVNLVYGTRRDNWNDAVRNGGARLGERNHFAKLTEDAVRDIRKSKDSYATLAMRHGVAKATVLNVRNGRGWRWLDADS